MSNIGQADRILFSSYWCMLFKISVCFIYLMTSKYINLFMKCLELF